MALKYTVIIKAGPDRPASTEPGSFLVDPITGQVFIATNEWVLIAGGNPIESYVEGTFERELARQESMPAGEIGLIWVKDSVSEARIYIDDWQPYFGG